MKKEIASHRFVFIAGTIIVAAISRLVPHIDNVTPVAAMALFGGAYLMDKRLAIIVPLLAMFVSDLFIGLSHGTLLFVYAGMVITSFIGIGIRKNPKMIPVALGSITSSAIFFILTNFGHWATFMGFAGGAAGLTGSYIAAIPFFRNSLWGDLIYNAVLFGAFSIAAKRFPLIATVKA